MDRILLLVIVLSFGLNANAQHSFISQIPQGMQGIHTMKMDRSHQYIVTASNNILSVWDINKGACLWSKIFSDGVVDDFVLSPDGMVIYMKVLDFTNFHLIIDTKNGEIISNSNSLNEYVIELHPISDKIFGARTLNGLNIYHLSSPEESGRLVHESISSSVIDTDKGMAVTGDKIGMIKVWDLESKQLINEVKISNHKISKMEIYDSNDILVVYDRQDDAIIWDLNNNVEVKRFNNVSTLAFSKNMKYMAVGLFDSNIEVWDFSTDVLQYSRDLMAIGNNMNISHLEGYIESIVFDDTESSMMIKVGIDVYMHCLMDLKSGDVLNTFQGFESMSGANSNGIVTASFAKENDLIITAAYNRIDVRKINHAEPIISLLSFGVDHWAAYSNDGRFDGHNFKKYLLLQEGTKKQKLNESHPGFTPGLIRDVLGIKFK